MTPLKTGTILVPLDGSKFAEAALPLAVSIALTTGRVIRLAHVRLLPLWPEEVAPKDTIDAMCRVLDTEGEAYLREVQHRLQGPGLRVDVTILPGDIVSAGESLIRHIQKWPVDLVIMATHGRGGVRRFWLGSVADELIRVLETPVLLVRPGQEPPTGDQIMVPIDGSSFSEQALDEACELAAATSRTIVLVRVIPPATTWVGIEAPYVAIDQNLVAATRTRAEEYLKAMQRLVEARGVRCATMTLLGASPAESILELARPDRFSLIVMATHGRRGLKRVVLGSVADKVVRAADIPVMVMRPPGDMTAPESQRALSHSYAL